MFAWTDERVALLTKLKAEGRSAAQIAAELGGGVTRNAVIGKCSRLGVPARAVENRPRIGRPATLTAPKPEPVATIAPQAAPIRNRAKAPPIPPTQQEPSRIGAGAAHAALQAHQCRWPIGDPAGEAFRFCAEPCMRATDLPRARNGQLRVPVYCAAHFGLSIQQPGSERRATRIMATAA